MTGRMRAAVSSLFVLALVGAMAPAPAVSAQIVNVLKPTVGEPPDGLTVSVGGGLDGAGGNTDKLQLKTDAGFRVKALPHTFFIVGDAAYGITEDEVDTQRGFGHIRHQWRFFDPFSVFSFVQANHNEFQLLILRIVYGLGPEMRLFRTEVAEWHAGVAPMHEWEKLSEPARDDQGFAFRLSAFVSQAYKAAEWFTAANTTFFQPIPHEPADFRLRNDTTLSFKITDRLGFRASVALTFDNRPPTDVEAIDWLISQGLAFTFEATEPNR